MLLCNQYANRLPGRSSAEIQDCRTQPRHPDCSLAIQLATDAFVCPKTERLYEIESSEARFLFPEGDQFPQTRYEIGTMSSSQGSIAMNAAQKLRTSCLTFRQFSDIESRRHGFFQKLRAEIEFIFKVFQSQGKIAARWYGACSRKRHSASHPTMLANYNLRGQEAPAKPVPFFLSGHGKKLGRAPPL
jgi:hypothetical protein